MDKATPFKFGTHIGRGQLLPPDHKLAPKWAWFGVRDPISKFWNPLNISQTGKAMIFKFGTHIGRGQFLPMDHKLAPKWVSPGVRDPISKFWVSRGGGILCRPPSRTACLLLNSCDGNDANQRVFLDIDC